MLSCWHISGKILASFVKVLHAYGKNSCKAKGQTVQSELLSKLKPPSFLQKLLVYVFLVWLSLRDSLSTYVCMHTCLCVHMCLRAHGHCVFLQVAACTTHPVVCVARWLCMLEIFHIRVFAQWHCSSLCDGPITHWASPLLGAFL